MACWGGSQIYLEHTLICPDRKGNLITGSRELLGLPWREVLRRKNDSGAGQWNWISWAGRWEAWWQGLDY